MSLREEISGIIIRHGLRGLAQINTDFLKINKK
jgi:hypothetical protein